MRGISEKGFQKPFFAAGKTHLPLSSQPSALIGFLKNKFIEVAGRNEKLGISVLSHS